MIDALQASNPTTTTSWQHVADSLKTVVTCSRPIVKSDDSTSNSQPQHDDFHNTTAAAQLVSSTSSSRKRALVIGVPLKDDKDGILASRSERFQLYLMQQCGFRKSEIKFLRNTREPTRDAITNEFAKMVDWSTNKKDGGGNETLVVYYCGGIHERCTAVSEESSLNGIDIIPNSFDAPIINPSDDGAPPITGNDILNDLVLQLPESTRLTLIFDTNREEYIPLPYYYSGHQKSNGGVISMQNLFPTILGEKKFDGEGQKNGLASMLLGALSETIGSLADEVSNSSMNLSDRSW